MRTAYGALRRLLKRGGNDLIALEGIEGRALQGLASSRTIVIDPAQAIAATNAIDDVAGLHAAALMVRAPFDWTLLDFADGVDITPTRCLVGVLLGPLTGHNASEGILLLRDKHGQHTGIYMSPDAFAPIQWKGTDHRDELQQLHDLDASGHAELEAKRAELADAMGRLVGVEETLRQIETSMRDHHAQLNQDRAALHGLAVPYACLAMLESANVDLVDSDVQYPKGHVAHGNPRLEVLIRQAKRTTPRDTTATTREFSHRFEVRGNFAHHFEETAAGTPNRLFEKWSLLRSEKVVQVGGKPCIRIWRPPYVKGPEDKPLVVKTRYLPKSQALKSSA